MELYAVVKEDAPDDERYVCPCRVSKDGTMPGPKRRAFLLPKAVAVGLSLHMVANHAGKFLAELVEKR